jgi:hypothetical protein
MSDEWGRDAMEAWARDRGLTFKGEGLFPAYTHRLREGLDVGTHRAGVVVSESDHGFTSTGGFGKKPERHTMNIVSGRLPGGVEGSVGHHFHLELRHSGGEGGENWLAVPGTIVLAYVPEGARVARELRYADGAWVTDPPESDADVSALVSSVAELAAAWPGVIVEMRDGWVCVAANGVVESAAHLDGLCRIASALADGARQAAALHPPLDPTAPTRAQVLPPDLQWVEVMASKIQWTGPPASIPAAQEAYAGLHIDAHPDTGRQVSRVALIVVLVLGALGFLLAAALVFVFHDPIEGLAVAAACIIAAPKAIGAALRAGPETVQEDAAAASGLPGVEAFAREYAKARGMALEDRDEFRRRFSSPIPGAPLKVMYGQLGGNVTGRIVLWMARDERWVMRYWNMAVVPAPAGEAAGVLPQFRVERVGDVLVIAEQVTNDGRSVERLDALRVTAVRAAGGVPELAQ